MNKHQDLTRQKSNPCNLLHTHPHHGLQANLAHDSPECDMLCSFFLRAYDAVQCRDEIEQYKSERGQGGRAEQCNYSSGECTLRNYYDIECRLEFSHSIMPLSEGMQIQYWTSHDEQENF